MITDINQKFRLLLFVILSLGLLCLPSTGALASSPHWKKPQPYTLFAQGESLSRVLKNFAASYDVPVIISDNVQETVNGQFENDHPQAFLENMAKLYGLSWYYDGSVLFIIRSDENENRIIKLTHLSAKKLKSSLTRLHIWDKQYHWRELPGQGMIYVSGPPRMIELVEKTAEMMDSQIKHQQEETYAVKVFPLQYASAHDRTLTFRQRTITVPGVATTLKQLIGNRLTNNATKHDSQGMTAVTNRGLKGKGLSQNSRSTKQSNNTHSAKNNAAHYQGEKSNTATTSNATIEPDVRTNSVVVYDTLMRMPLYQQLIDELDYPVDQIEIDVSIVNIRTSNIKDMGINWRAASDKHGVIGFGDIDTAQAGPDKNNIALAIGDGTSFSTILGSNASYFLARINAMTEEGNAQILSRPSIISSDNMEAILDNSSTFYVRVAGQEEVELFPVSVGSVLRVTPHIVSDHGPATIRLDVSIEDGQQTQDTVDGIPVVQNSTISTTATIAENESLLIGGYYYDTVSENISKVPVLHRIPLLGNLFKHTQNDVINMARLFLISPKIIPHASAQEQKTSAR